MNVSLTPELERWINDQVESGRYRSASELVRESLRLRQEVQELREAKLRALRRDLDPALAALDRGIRVPGEEAFERLEEELDDAGADP